LYPESSGQNTKERMKALTTAKNGFELAEYDLAIRGGGELYGARQWGMSDIAMEAIKNIKMVEAARNEAKSLIQKDVELSIFPLLKERVSLLHGKLHGE